MTDDQLGRYGELIVMARLACSIPRDFRRPLFRPTLLGDKYPVADLLVDVLDDEDRPQGFFMVQVRATRMRDKHDDRLAVRVKRDEYNRLAGLPVPSYLAAVGVPAGEGDAEICIRGAAQSRSSGISHIARRYSLRDDQTLIDLYAEVLQCWEALRPHIETRWKSRFVDA